MDPRSVPALIADLGSADDAVRLEALRWLGRMGPDAVESAGAVAALASDPDASIRLAVAETLGSLGSEDGAAALVRLLDDTGMHVREAAEKALWSLPGMRDWLAEGVHRILGAPDQPTPPPDTAQPESQG